MCYYLDILLGWRAICSCTFVVVLCRTWVCDHTAEVCCPVTWDYWPAFKRGAGCAALSTGGGISGGRFAQKVSPLTISLILGASVLWHCCIPVFPICFLSCADSLLGERGVGPWLRHVWAEGTNSCRSSFCSPDVRKFDCKTQTYAGLSWMINPMMKKNLRSHWNACQPPLFSLCIHSAGVLFSNDRCCVCYQLVNSLQLNIGCVFAVSCVAVAKWDALQWVSSQFSFIHDILDTAWFKESIMLSVW